MHEVALQILKESAIDRHIMARDLRAIGGNDNEKEFNEQRAVHCERQRDEIIATMRLLHGLKNED